MPTSKFSLDSAYKPKSGDLLLLPYAGVTP